MRLAHSLRLMLKRESIEKKTKIKSTIIKARCDT